MTTLLRMHEVARRIGVHRATIYRMVASGVLPPPVRLSGTHGQHGGVVAWPENEIEQYGQKLIAERDAHHARRIPVKSARRKK
jgi:excisionase family DNA binding protein